MFGLMVIINIVSVVANWNGDFKVAAIVSLVAATWAFGIAYNYRVDGDPTNIPNFWVLVSSASGVAGVVLAIVGFAT